MTAVPWFIWATIVLVDVAVAGLFWFGLRTAAKRAGLPPESTSGLGNAAIIGMVLWLPVAVVISVIFVAPMRPGAGAALAFLSLIMVPVIVVCAFVGRSQGRRLLSVIPQHWLIGAQIYRVVGAIFLAAAAAGVLPMWFAGPAAYGDALTGVTAPLVAWWAFRRGVGWKPAVLLWNVVGLADFVVALGLGSQTYFVAAAQAAFGASDISTGSVRLLPLVLIPQFLVPAGIILHVFSIWKLATERSAGSDVGRSPSRYPSDLSAGR